MKNTFAKAAVIGLLLTLAYDVSITDGGVGWPMRGYDVRNTNASPHYGMKKGVLAWRFEVGSLSWYSRPAVGPDGTIYSVFNSKDVNGFFGELRAIARDGTLKWKTGLTDSQGRRLMCFTTPIVAPNGNLYVGWGRFRGFDFVSLAMLAFDSSGELLWRYEPNIGDQTAWDNEPALGPDGTIYASLNTFFTQSGNQHCSILAIDSADGALKWRWVSPVQDVFGDTPVLAPGGRLIYESFPFWDDARLYSLDAAAGELIWSETFPLGGSGEAPSVDAQGNIYAPNVPESQWLTKYDPDGNVLWEHETDAGSITAAPPLAGGKVYLPTGSGLHIVDSETGDGLNVILPSENIFSTVLDRAGNIYMLTGDMGLQAYSPAGEPMWSARTRVSSRMAIVNGADGLILVTDIGWLHAFESLYPYGDMNCDGSLDLSDVEHFIAALLDAKQYENEHPDCDLNLADLNSDGSVDLRDVEPFIAALLG